MTSEIPGPDIQTTVEPDRWDGHSFDDDCEWTVGNVTDYKGFLKTYEQNRKSKQPFLVASLEFISEFANNGGGESTPLHKYTTGQIFDASRHNPGTVIRITSQVRDRDENNPMPGNPAVYYGVVCDAKTENADERAIALWIVPPTLNLLFMGVSNSLIEVGKTEHDRNRNVTIKGDHDFISKIISVETVLPGKGSPKKVEEPKNRSFSFKFGFQSK